MGLVDKLKGDSSPDELSFTADAPAPLKDKAPKGAKPKVTTPATGKATSAELKKIEDALTELLASPAMALDLKGDDWPAQHIRNRSPELAKRITKIAEIKPEFRQQLLKMIDGGVWGPLIFAGVMYVLPLGVYYELVPLPVPARMALAGGTPTRSEMDEERGDSVVDPFEQERERIEAQDRQGE